jgi:hypothetical protein
VCAGGACSADNIRVDDRTHVMTLSACEGARSRERGNRRSVGAGPLSTRSRPLPAEPCREASRTDTRWSSRERWNPPSASVLQQASLFRSDVTVFGLNAAAAAQSCLERAFRRNTAERVSSVEAAHNPEVAGSNPASATSKTPGNRPFCWNRNASSLYLRAVTALSQAITSGFS